MIFKPGDLVIKNTGGNKMRILSCNNNIVECGCFTESYHQSTFEEKELVYLNQFDKIIVGEKRNDLINNILEDKI